MFGQIHQMVPFLAHGDAVGNQVLELRRLLRQWGWQSEIFAENWAEQLSNVCHSYHEYRRFSDPGNLLILHYCSGGEINRAFLEFQDHLAIYYHNITPPHFFYGVNELLAQELTKVLQGLHSLAGRVPAIAASSYNAEELQAMGFKVLGISPCVPKLEYLDAGLASSWAANTLARFVPDDFSDWLFVGRIAPNKCIQDIIKAFYYYNNWINPKSRLFLVGSGVGMEVYVEGLHRLVTRLGLERAVLFSGHVTVDVLAAFYKMADLYVSMSEHEGFGIPLVEAMYYGVPVLAYASTAVPSTLGNAGVLIHKKKYPLVAEIAHELISNHTMRSRIVRSERAQFEKFAPDVSRAQFRACLEAAVKYFATSGHSSAGQEFGLSAQPIQRPIDVPDRSGQHGSDAS